MKTLWNILSIIILLAILYACIEEYIPPSVRIKANRYLTVNGILYNDDPVKTIILRRSIDAWEPDSLYEMVKNARVTITDDNENEVDFYQTEDGVYQSLFDPQHERKYQLHIIDEFGNEYLSEQVAMEATPAIDSVYWKMVNSPVSEDKQGRGIEIMVATHADLNESSYFKWDWTETWVIRTYFMPGYKYIDGSVVPNTDDIPGFCWSENLSDDIIVGSTESLSKNQITNKVIQKVPFTQNKLLVRYSILVRQYALSKNAYEFWNNLQNSNETSGSLFDRQPSEIKSNIMSISNSQEPVLGYFDICEVKTKRIFIDRDEIPIVRGISSGYEHCEADSINLDEVERYVKRGYSIIEPVRFGRFIIGWLVTQNDCTDCRYRGTEIKPVFWED